MKATAEIGSTVNRYQILTKLAVGGMAEIFLARGASAAGVERYCVLKRILRERASDTQLVRMFVDEARLAAQLQHPNIASVFDVGMLGESYFFTMEYVHGETVRALLQRAQELRRPVPLACVLTIIAGTAAGLHHAHERNASDGRPLGIVHRDVSPSNLMVSFEGNIKVVDFGVAKAADRAVETKAGTVKGKISYLSPEQCRCGTVDRRSDLFSLGIVMWEMLTGSRLYRRASDFASMAAIVGEPSPLPSTRRSEVPRAVDDIVLRLLAKSVTDRFQTAAEVVDAIEHASMRAGTILSTSAVGRLVCDLFGARPEPWREIDADTIPYEPVTLVSPLLTKASRPSPIEVDELDLSGVLETSSSSTADEAQGSPASQPRIGGTPPASPAAAEDRGSHRSSAAAEDRMSRRPEGIGWQVGGGIAIAVVVSVVAASLALSRRATMDVVVATASLDAGAVGASHPIPDLKATGAMATGAGSSNDAIRERPALTTPEPVDAWLADLGNPPAAEPPPRNPAQPPPPPPRDPVQPPPTTASSSTPMPATDGTRRSHRPAGSGGRRPATEAPPPKPEHVASTARTLPATVAPLPEVPRNVAPAAFDGNRIAGDKNIVPEDTTKAQISRSGMTKVVGNFKLCVTPEGAVDTVTPLKSTGFPDYDAKLQSTMRTRWRYRPFAMNGKRIAACSIVTFIYSQQ